MHLWVAIKIRQFFGQFEIAFLTIRSMCTAKRLISKKCTASQKVWKLLAYCLIFHNLIWITILWINASESLYLSSSVSTRHCRTTSTALSMSNFPGGAFCYQRCDRKRTMRYCLEVRSSLLWWSFPAFPVVRVSHFAPHITLGVSQTIANNKNYHNCHIRVPCRKLQIPYRFPFRFLLGARALPHSQRGGWDAQVHRRP